MDFRTTSLLKTERKHLRTVIRTAYIHTVLSLIRRIHLSILKDMQVTSRSSRTQDLVPFPHREEHISKDNPKEIIR
jgi:hypothetical protein